MRKALSIAGAGILVASIPATMPTAAHAATITHTLTLCVKAPTSNADPIKLSANGPTFFVLNSKSASIGSPECISTEAVPGQYAVTFDGAGSPPHCTPDPVNPSLTTCSPGRTFDHYQVARETGAPNETTTETSLLTDLTANPYANTSTTVTLIFK